MALNIENIVAELETATILELSELVKAIEEKFDVSARSCSSSWTSRWSSRRTN